MAMKVRGDIMPYTTGIDTTKIMAISRRVATVSGFAVQFNKAGNLTIPASRCPGMTR